MVKLMFDTEEIRMISLFESLTKVPIKDCILNENLICFVVEEGKMGMAIGRNGSKVKRIERMIGKNIKLFEFSNDLPTFVKNIIPQAKAVKIRNESEKVIVEVKVEKKNRAIVIGRDKKNLNFYKKLLQRSYKIDDLIIR